MRAIVLSGGGSKGAYQIGVWKALRKLRINYDIVTGTSVGALNAALMTQDTFYKSLFLWNRLSFSDVLDEKINDNITKKEIYKKYANQAIKGGMKINNLESTVSKAMNIKKIYKSPINLGIVTVKSKGLKPVLLTKNEINPNELKDYLIASASCFPAFSKKNINGEAYIDGGLYDNLPINLAIDMGATEIIAVDLDAIGIKKKVINKDIPVTYISPSSDIGPFLIFNKVNARRAIRIGYNDTMKKFKKLDGNKYSFKKDQLNKSYLKNYEKFKNELEKNINKEILELGTYKKIINSKNWEKEYIEIIEQLGNIFEIDNSKIYDINNFNKMIIKEFEKTEKIDKFKNIIKTMDLKKILNKKLLIKNLYYNSSNKYISLFPNEFLMILYLKIIIDKI